VEPIGLIKDACVSKEIPITDESLELFRKYQSLLIGWNKKVNLISSKDETRIVTRHFLQSLGLLLVFRFPQGSRILDLGTGGGFPGLPIKIIRPDLDMVLVEATQKKVSFLNELLGILEIKNAVALPVRIESLRNDFIPVDIVVSRAVADLRKLVRWSRSCLKKKGGVLIAIKGKRINEELAGLEFDGPIRRSISWEVIPYNPFPEQFVLNNSHVVIVKISKS